MANNEEKENKQEQEETTDIDYWNDYFNTFYENQADSYLWG